MYGKGRKAFIWAWLRTLGRQRGKNLLCKTDICLFLPRFVAISMHFTSRMSLLADHLLWHWKSIKRSRKKHPQNQLRQEERNPIKRGTLTPYQHTHMHTKALSNIWLGTGGSHDWFCHSTLWAFSHFHLKFPLQTLCSRGFFLER